ncbi:MAG TPA: DUF3048 C-terminal domain-containing protein [Anaerolineales bacterium]|nr:DUF3048 C-terminal domain-containing protein [Anaerolineales bacterium]
MKKNVLIGAIMLLMLVACGKGDAQPTITSTIPQVPNTQTPSPIPPTETVTATLEPTTTGTPERTSTAQPLIYGPTDFPDGINPLTGLQVADPDLLERRPIAVKINIVPRYLYRPPFGLSLADIVFDYYHNSGYSRFFAVFYGNDADLVGPIRSGRLLDHELVQMYKSLFAYGSADELINQRFFNAVYSDRLILEGARSDCPPTSSAPLCRYDPAGGDLLLGGTAAMSAYVESRNVDNSQQNLDGMTFDGQVPGGGTPVSQVFVRYSRDNYVRWDYNPASSQYLRFQDNSEDTGQGEEYAPLIDRLNDEQITADNVVVIVARHEFYQQPPNEIIEIYLSGSGTAYAFRDGKVYEVRWNRPTTNSVLFLTNPDGTPFPYRPGTTWYQVVGESTAITQPSANAWRFNWATP